MRYSTAGRRAAVLTPLRATTSATASHAFESPGSGLRLQSKCLPISFSAALAFSKLFANTSVRNTFTTFALALLLFGCAEERIRENSTQLLAAGNYEAAVETLERGVREHPDSVQLRERLFFERAQAVSELIAQASAARTAGRFDLADQLLQRAAAFDFDGRRTSALLADSAAAKRQAHELERAETLVAEHQLEAASKVIEEALRDNPRHLALLSLKKRVAIEQRQSQLRTAEYSLAENRSVTLDFRDANLRAVLDVLNRNSNINFVIDKDVRSDLRVTVYAKTVRVEDALNMILGTNQLARKVLDERTILIYANTPEKQREYQEQIVKVFYLANGDAKGAAAFLKSMMKVREPYVDEHNNMLSLRDSLENIQLAERLISLFDNPDAEVLIEAQVLEVDANRLTELGINFPNQITLTPLGVSTSGTSSGSGGTATFTLNDFPLSKRNLGIGIPSASLNLQNTIGHVNTLANPQIRTRSREKAKILIGDKVPTITTTTTPGVAGFVSESVSYQDVGIKLEVEPTVFPDDDVSIRLNLEVSALGTQIKTATGTIAYQISTRNASTVLRLRDGETQLLAGLISSDERTSASRLPGLGAIPILGRLFSDQTDSQNRTELVLAITPHIVRGQPHLDAAESEAWVGTEAYQRLMPAGGRFDKNVGRGAPAAAASAPRKVVMGGSAPAAAAASAASLGAAPAGESTSAIWQAPTDVHAGALFEVELQLRSGAAIGPLALEIRYPANLIGLVGPAPSTLPEAQANGDLAAHSEPDNVGVVDVPRLIPNTPDRTLSLVRLQFKALRDGAAPLTVQLKPVDGAVPKVELPAPLVLRVVP